MPQFFIEIEKLGDEMLHILLFVLRDNCGDGVEISGKVRCHVVTDPCPKLLAIIDYYSDYASNCTARLRCHSSAETLKIKYQERLHIRAKGDEFYSSLQTGTFN
jgi:hypothetical protein